MKYKKWYLRVFSRHPSHNVIRKGRPLNILWDHVACIRLGSTTDKADKWSRSPYQINTVEAIEISSNKIKMKTAFEENNIKSPEFWETTDIPQDMFPIIAKKIVGSRARGIKLLETPEALAELNVRGYYFEKYYNYTREYRIHCAPILDSAFYSCRKMLKTDTPDEFKYFRNDSNCVWYIETNPKFDKPCNWDEITEEAINAVAAVGLDIGAVDVRVRGKKSKGKHPFQIIEVNSAPSFGDMENGELSIVSQKYAEIIPKILNQIKSDINNV
jgi:hypothetical protein